MNKDSSNKSKKVAKKSKAERGPQALRDLPMGKAEDADVKGGVIALPLDTYTHTDLSIP